MKTLTIILTLLSSPIHNEAGNLAKAFEADNLEQIIITSFGIK